MTELLFTENEWNAAIPTVVEEMTAFLRPYRAAIYEHHAANGDDQEHGTGWGSGSYLNLGDKVVVLTNEHVATVRHQGRTLAHQFDGQDDVRRIVGNHLEYPDPLDLALLPVDMNAWTDPSNQSRAIEIEQVALAHDPVPGEILTFTGFAGERVTFHFGTVLAQGTCYTAREVELPENDQFSSRFHFGIDYRPDLATDVIGRDGLPDPHGFSGAAVWNTNFVAAKMAGVQWTPGMAKVTGVLWGWPSSSGLLVATRAEYLRSFLLGTVEA
ncbi:MAG: trypsin-like peptidase domain-containing protein [Rhodobacteraceae bacterium]|nr:trypsin-like peptidase domain-containing protein [Paracoccaceae bacterium]